MVLLCLVGISWLNLVVQPGVLSSLFLYKRYSNPTLTSAQKQQKHDLLFHQAQFCVIAASARLCNYRSPLPIVDLALITGPVVLFLPRLRFSTLAQSIQGISPSVLGVSVTTQMATQAPCISNTPLTTSLTVTSCSTAEFNVFSVLIKRKEIIENWRICILQLYSLVILSSAERLYFWKIITPPKKNLRDSLQQWRVWLSYLQSYFSIYASLFECKPIVYMCLLSCSRKKFKFNQLAMRRLLVLDLFLCLVELFFYRKMNCPAVQVSHCHSCYRNTKKNPKHSNNAYIPA